MHGKRCAARSLHRSRADDKRRALEAGFDAQLAKPVDPEQLLAMVAQLAQKPR
jgi:CheY-like chemotaxis protein